MVRKDGTVHKEHKNIKSFDNYVGKVKIDSKEYYIRTTVQNEIDNSGTHSFMVSQMDLYENTADGLSLPITTRARVTTDGIVFTDESRTIPITSRGTTNSNGIVDAKLQQFFENSKSELTDIDNPYYQPDILGEELYLDAVASEKPLTEKDEDVLLRPASIMNSEPTWDVRNESFSEYARRYAEWAHDKQVYENISGATIPPFPRWDKDKISLSDYMAAFREWRQASNIAELAQSYGEEIRAQHNRWRRFIRKRIDEFKALESFYKYFNKNHDAEINSANDAYNDEFRKLARAEHFYTQEFYNKAWSNLNFK